MSLNHAFRKSSFPNGATMWKARYKNPTSGEFSVVEIYGNNPYSPNVHKGHLYCAHCDVRVHFRKEIPAIGGTSADAKPAHFATNRGQKHSKACEWKFPEPWESDIEYDKTRGFRLHINAPEFHEGLADLGNIYNRAAGGRIRTNNQELRVREPRSVGSATDIVKFLKEGHLDRIADTKVIFRNNGVDWNQFLLRSGRESGLYEFIERMKEQKASGIENPMSFAFMEVKTTKSYYFPYSPASNAKIDCCAINLKEKDSRGKPQNVVVSLDMRGVQDTRVLVAFQGKQRDFLILGVPQYREHVTPYATTHYLNVKVTSPNQIVEAKIEDVWKIAVENHARRQSRKAPEATP